MEGERSRGSEWRSVSECRRRRAASDGATAPMSSSSRFPLRSSRSSEVRGPPSNERASTVRSRLRDAERTASRLSGASAPSPSDVSRLPSSLSWTSDDRPSNAPRGRCATELLAMFSVRRCPSWRKQPTSRTPLRANTYPRCRIPCHSTGAESPDM